MTEQGEESASARYLRDARTIVIKVGSSILIDPEQPRHRSGWLAALADDVASLRAAGQAVLIVTSGAVALGAHTLGTARPVKLDQKQATAAVGQTRLMNAWQEAFARHGIAVGQMLLTREDSVQQIHAENVRATLSALLAMGALPVINENDSVATEELRHGDNDRLSAHVAGLAGADLLLLLSDVDGLYSSDPSESGARHIACVNEMTEEIEAMAQGASSRGVGTGGMTSKLAAARHAASFGCVTLIASGRENNPLARLREGARATVFETGGEALPATA